MSYLATVKAESNTKYVCVDCKQEKPSSCFYKLRQKYHQSRCKDCQRKYMTEYSRQYRRRAKSKEWRKAYYKLYDRRPEVTLRNKAKHFTNNRITAGLLQRTPCIKCGKEPSEAHHIDYHKPRLIMWLCMECHRNLHKKKEE